MQAILLAGGQSLRLYPFANGVHKSMISILGKPLICHTVEKLKAVGLTDIIIVTDPKSIIKDYLGDGKNQGVSIRYITQPQPLGMANALLCAKKLIKGDFVILHSYHVDADVLYKELRAKKTQNRKGVILAKERKDTWKYGILKTEGEYVKEVIEKPERGNEPSNLSIVGIYLLSKEFVDIAAQVPKEHYQFEKALSIFAQNSAVAFVKTSQDTVVLKYPWDLLALKNYLLKGIKTSIAANADIAKSAEISGNVIIEKGVKIMEGVKIKGPCYIGKNVYIGTNVIIRNGVNLEENCIIGANMEVKNSLIMQGSTTHSGFIGDSVIGQRSKIAAQFCSANVRLDRKTVKVIAKKEKMDSGLKYLGVIIGNNTEIGIKVSTMPGVIIGNNVTIGPATVVKNNVEDDNTYYTKFHEIVTKK